MINALQTQGPTRTGAAAATAVPAQVPTAEVSGFDAVLAQAQTAWPPLDLLATGPTIPATLPAEIWIGAPLPDSAAERTDPKAHLPRQPHQATAALAAAMSQLAPEVPEMGTALADLPPEPERLPAIEVTAPDPAQPRLDPAAQGQDVAPLAGAPLPAILPAPPFGDPERAPQRHEASVEVARAEIAVEADPIVTAKPGRTAPILSAAPAGDRDHPLLQPFATQPLPVPVHSGVRTIDRIPAATPRPFPTPPLPAHDPAPRPAATETVPIKTPPPDQARADTPAPIEAGPVQTPQHHENPEPVPVQANAPDRSNRPAKAPHAEPVRSAPTSPVAALVKPSPGADIMPAAEPVAEGPSAAARIDRKPAAARLPAAPPPDSAEQVVKGKGPSAPNQAGHQEVLPDIPALPPKSAERGLVVRAPATPLAPEDPGPDLVSSPAGLPEPVATVAQTPGAVREVPAVPERPVVAPRSVPTVIPVELPEPEAPPVVAHDRPFAPEIAQALARPPSKDGLPGPSPIRAVAFHPATAKLTAATAARKPSPRLSIMSPDLALSRFRQMLDQPSQAPVAKRLDTAAPMLPQTAVPAAVPDRDTFAMVEVVIPVPPQPSPDFLPPDAARTAGTRPAEPLVHSVVPKDGFVKPMTIPEVIAPLPILHSQIARVATFASPAATAIRLQATTEPAQPSRLLSPPILALQAPATPTPPSVIPIRQATAIAPVQTTSPPQPDKARKTARPVAEPLRRAAPSRSMDLAEPKPAAPLQPAQAPLSTARTISLPATAPVPVVRSAGSSLPEQTDKPSVAPSGLVAHEQIVTEHRPAVAPLAREGVAARGPDPAPPGAQNLPGNAMTPLDLAHPEPPRVAERQTVVEVSLPVAAVDPQPVPLTVPQATLSHVPAPALAERPLRPLPKGLVTTLAFSVTQSGHSRAELVLEPAELGRIRFDLVTQGDQVQVNLTVERPETLDLLRTNAEALRQEFRAAGLDTGSLNFSQWNQRGQERSQPDLGPEEALSSIQTPTELPAKAARNMSGSGLDLRL